MESRRALGRFGAYAVLGWGIEVCFTAAKDLATGVGDRRLRGESYVWMAPIYGIGALAGETVHRSLRSRPIWERAGAYALTFWAVEASTGEVLRRLLGDVPWGESYRDHPDQLGNGLIRLSYAPSWAAAGLALEVIEPIVRRLQLAPVER
jgi:uncharacterized membrane protein